MNYGELKTLVQQYLECSEATFTANIDRFVRNCEEDIFRQVQLQDLMETSTANLIPGDAYLGLPSDFLSAYSLSIVDSTGQTQYLLSKDHSFIKECYPDPTVQGLPRFYAFFDEETLLLGPTPDDDYQVELNYYFEPASLADGADDGTTWLSINGENAMLFGTIVQGYIYLKGDQDVMKQYQDQYSQAIATLKIIAEGRNRKDSYRKSDRRLSV